MRAAAKSALNTFFMTSTPKSKRGEKYRARDDYIASSKLTCGSTQATQVQTPANIKVSTQAYSTGEDDATR